MESQSYIIQKLKAMYKALPKDPLLERGIPKHWLCAVNWQVYTKVKEQIDLNRQRKPDSIIPTLPGRELDMFMGRRVVIIQEVGNEIIYGDELTLHKMYPEWSKRVMEAMQEEIDRRLIEGDNSQNDGS